MPTSATYRIGEIVMGSAKRNAIISVVLGFLLLGGGIFFRTLDEVSCGTGQQMKPGDICTETRRGTTNKYTYEERKALQSMQGWLMIGGGVVGFAAAGWFVLSDRRRRQKADEAAVAAQSWTQAG